MLSSVNAFGGLSSAELLTLFGAISSSSSSSETSNSTASSTSTGISGSSANDPVNAIQAILAQAQMETSAGGSASISTVAAAYAVQTESSGGVLATSVTDEAAYTIQRGNSKALVGASETMSSQYTGQVDGISYSTSYGVTSVSTASGLVDYFQMALTIGNDSLAVGFTVDGLGQVGALPSNVGGAGVSVGHGSQGELLQITAGVEGQDFGVGIDFTVGGLDAAQKQQVAAAFEEAMSSPNLGLNSPYEENFGSGFSATIVATGAYSLDH